MGDLLWILVDKDPRKESPNRVMSQVADLHSACHGIHQIEDSKEAPINKDGALNMLKNFSCRFVIYLLGKLWSSHSGHIQ